MQAQGIEEIILAVSFLIQKTRKNILFACFMTSSLRVTFLEGRPSTRGFVLVQHHFRGWMGFGAVQGWCQGFDQNGISLSMFRKLSEAQRGSSVKVPSSTTES